MRGAIDHLLDDAIDAGPVALGLLLYGAGFALTVGSQVFMADSWRIGVDPAERTALVTTGPFAFVRNPIFTGMTLALAGVTVVAWHPIGAVAVAVAVIAIELQTRLVEEPYLRRTHPDYADYAARVGRFIPRVVGTPRPPDRAGRTTPSR